MSAELERELVKAQDKVEKFVKRMQETK